MNLVQVVMLVNVHLVKMDIIWEKIQFVMFVIQYVKNVLLDQIIVLLVHFLNKMEVDVFYVKKVEDTK